MDFSVTPSTPLGVELVLTKGKVAQISPEDFDRVNRHGWAAACTNGTQWYGIATISSCNVYLHRFIMGVTNPKIQVDHRDGDGLNCLRTNLRTATHQQNMMNRRSKKEFKGVFFYKRTKRWMAQIKMDYKSIFLGYYSTPEEAARKYDEKAKELFGEFACLNYP